MAGNCWGRAFFYLCCLVLLGPLRPLPAEAGGEEDPLERGIAEYRRERFEEARALLGEARERQPASAQAAFYLGLTSEQLGDYPAATEFFRQALELSPRINDAYPELAEVLIARELFAEAAEVIAEAERERIQPGQMSFLKGVLLERQGQNQAAAAAFTEAARLDPRLGGAAELQIALLDAREGRLRRARANLDALADIDPDSEQAALAREYGESLERLLAEHRNWRFTLGAALRHDDNVIAKPSSAISGVEISGEEDFGLLTTLRAEFTPLLDRPWSLRGRFSLAANTHRDKASHNVLAPALSLTPGYNFNRGALTLPISYQRVWLHGREYQGDFSVGPALSLELAPGHIARFSAGVTRRELLQAPLLPEENRDGEIFRAGAAYLRVFARGRGVFSLGAEGLRDRAAGANWENRGQRYSGGLLLPAGKKSRFSFTLDHLRQDYDHIHSLFMVARRDRITSWSAAWQRDLAPSTLLILQYSGTRAASNLQIYDYRRNVYSVGVEYRF